MMEFVAENISADQSLSDYHWIDLEEEDEEEKNNVHRKMRTFFCNKNKYSHFMYVHIFRRNKKKNTDF